MPLREDDDPRDSDEDDFPASGGSQPLGGMPALRQLPAPGGSPPQSPQSTSSVETVPAPCKAGPPLQPSPPPHKAACPALHAVPATPPLTEAVVPLRKALVDGKVDGEEWLALSTHESMALGSFTCVTGPLTELASGSEEPPPLPPPPPPAAAPSAAPAEAAPAAEPAVEPAPAAEAEGAPAAHQFPFPWPMDKKSGGSSNLGK